MTRDEARAELEELQTLAHHPAWMRLVEWLSAEADRSRYTILMQDATDEQVRLRETGRYRAMTEVLNWPLKRMEACAAVVYDEETE